MHCKERNLANVSGQRGGSVVSKSHLSGPY